MDKVRRGWDNPTCAKCGREMTPATARVHPEFFLHDACLPEELRPQPERETRLGNGVVRLHPPAGVNAADFDTALRLTRTLYAVLAGSEVDEMRDLFAAALATARWEGAEEERRACVAVVEAVELHPGGPDFQGAWTAKRDLLATLRKRGEADVQGEAGAAAAATDTFHRYCKGCAQAVGLPTAFDPDGFADCDRCGSHGLYKGYHEDAVRKALGL